MLRFIAFAVLLFPNTTYACECMAPLPEYDADVLARAGMIGRYNILSATKADWSKPEGAVIKIKLQPENVYYGFVGDPEKEPFFVENDLSDGCSQHIGVGQTLDLILLNKEDGFVVADMCTDLSQSGWAALRNKH